MIIMEAETPRKYFGRWESLAVTRLQLFFEDVELGSATGFFYRFGKDPVLATNWHVLAGAHPETNRIIDGRGYVPNRITFNMQVRDLNNSSIITFENRTLEIAKDRSALWYQSVFPQRDVGFLNLRETLPDYEMLRLGDRIVAFSSDVIVNVDERQNPISVEPPYPLVSDTVFILGYPVGLSAQGIAPVWKSGTVATEPYYTAFDKPVFLVDSLTRSGMSGSPVLSHNNRMMSLDGEIVEWESKSPALVGIYAGREGITGTESDMALGRVWHRHVLDDTIMKNRRGPYLANSAFNE